MTDRQARAARNQERSLAAFLAKKAEFDALLTELHQASEGHFGTDPETVLWGEAAWLADATAKLKDIAPTKPADHLMVVNISGRGDKDLASVAEYLGTKI